MKDFARFICIHGHFYQPSRENPWLEAVEIQDSAYPYHDWNERITAECYAPNAAARILDAENRIIDIVSNYSRISFNFGPTLLSWMETNVPETYRAVIEADRRSIELRSGHGNAIAQIYNHIIMPLANTRDKRTQVRWGVKDFDHRFGRSPEGMWLSETAVDLETLDILSECGIKFTVLAPHQAGRIARLGTDQWEDVSGGRIDPARPYVCKLASGRTLAIFFYDGPISRAVAFESLLNRGEDFANRLLAGFSDQRNWNQILSIATDGETYGHHHKFADMALVFALNKIESGGQGRLTNYAEYLEKYPPDYEVQIVENTSWSCAHGVERWRANCGCNSGGYSEGHPGRSQEWRAPLRETFDWLRDQFAERFAKSAGEYVKDPWEARDGYIDVILERSDENIERFIGTHGRRGLSDPEKSIVLKLMELQRHLMLMYTSCGWFFDELSGIETVQVIQFAGRAVQLAEGLFGEPFEEEFKGKLSRGKSNLASQGDGSRIYDRFVKPAMVDLEKVAAHYAISSVVEDYGDLTEIHRYTVTKQDFRKLQAGEAKLAVGRLAVTSRTTLESAVAGFSVLHLGSHIFNGGASISLDDEAYQAMKAEMTTSFERGAFADVLKLIDVHFGMHSYSLLHLFKDEQRKLLNHVIGATLDAFEHAYRLIYENNRVLMLFMRETGMPVPKAFLTAAEFTLNLDIKRAFGAEEIDIERVKNAVTEIDRWQLVLEAIDVEFMLRRRLEGMMVQLHDAPSDVSLLSKLRTVMTLLPSLPLRMNLWRIQNIYFGMAKALYRDVLQKAESGDHDAAKWIEVFKQIGQDLSFNMDAILQKG